MFKKHILPVVNALFLFQAAYSAQAQEHAPDSIVVAERSVTSADGAVTPTDVSLTSVDGAVSRTDVSLTPTDVSLTSADGAVTPIDVSLTSADGALTPTDDSITENDLTLITAIRQIVPADYSIDAKNLSLEAIATTVLLKKHKHWMEAASETIAQVPNIFIQINEAAKNISLVQIKPEIQTPLMNKSPKIWAINTGEKISSAFSRWVNDAGWGTLFWEAPEFVSELQIDLEGDLTDAITKIITSLRSQGHTVKAIFYGGNKVIRIVEGAR